MKIGIISDIHAYLEPLETALNLFETQSVDEIFCAGDLVDGGEDGDAVVRLLREMNISCVQGNHDRDVFVDQAWIRRGLKNSGEKTSPLLLESETVGYVTSLPITRYFDWFGISICLAHGIPESNTRYLFSDSSEARFHEVIQQTNTDIVILGHTHEPMIANINNQWILNPGSVSRNRFDDSRTDAILTLPEIKFDVFNLDTKSIYTPQMIKIKSP